ncbi:ThuA domain-containing protein [Pleomorphovibrio marinus]|uniref:ThuA domain-containing protein n=1 Tax=Pleomorphovibrio marinus TaxID=2164132 RepID=UPI000E0B8C7B|nr:ThuA domain-containing protein [Pleomorphovibrio marinus]
MKKLLLLFSIGVWGFTMYAQGDDIQVLLITGGHDFERNPFFDMLEGMEGLVFTEVKHPQANDYFKGDKAKPYDVILFYDMVQDINPEQKEGFKKLVESGIGLVFLHHALVSYQDWDYFQEIVGGRYHEGGEKASNYTHDVHFNAEVVDGSHPVLNGITDFELFDEIYGNVEISNKVSPLLKTDHPESMPYISWAQEPTPTTRSIYIQPGHGPQVYSLDPFQRLLKQALTWAAFK